jgi:type I restriction enzyme S subunit
MTRSAELRELGEFINGLAFKPSDWVEEGIRIIRIQNLTESTQIFNRTRREVHPKYVVNQGDILVSWSASLGVFKWEDEEPGLLNQHIFKVIPKESIVDKRYLRYALEMALSDMTRHLHGATMQHVNRGEFLSTRVPLPPLEEQRRIADILDRAEALRAKRRQAIAYLDTLAQSIFIEMFERPGNNWPVRPVGDYVSQFQGGRSFQADTSEDPFAEFRVLKVSAITGMKFRPEESKAVQPDYVAPSSHLVRKGDLLFSRANTSALVGAVALVDEDYKNLLLPDKIWRFVWKEPQNVDPVFVWTLFQRPRVREEISKRATGTSGSMKNISQAKLLSMKTIFPPIQDQSSFAQVLRRTAHLGGLSNDALFHFDSLFASLQHRAFRGEL